MPTYPTSKELRVIRMEIQTVVVGGLQMPSLVVLKRHDSDGPDINLPIRIGPVEAMCITSGIEASKKKRPLTHDLMGSIIDSLGGRLISICITAVKGTTFYATLQMARSDGSRDEIDCRPSDAIALAVRRGVPIYAREQVVETATMPDFQKVEKDNKRRELEAFHDFVEGLSPDDFA